MLIYLWVVCFFLSYRNRLTNNFPEIFGEGEEEGYDAQSQFSRKWGWYGVVYQIAQGNLLRFEEVTELPLRTALTFLEYEIDKNNVERSLMKKNS